MSDLTLLVLRLGFLILLWLFVFGVVYSLRADLFGRSARKVKPRVAAAAPAPKPVPVAVPPAPAPRPAAPAPVSSATSRTRANTHTCDRLVILSGPRAGQDRPLGTGPISIGRSSDSNVILKDDYTSTHHARLLLWGEDWMLQDLDSTNGTFLDGKRISAPTPIHLGDVIKVGATTFELR
ncbi:FHA domain-containing protein [Mycetocola lacteus]|uniref:FHA domain-containing protein n=1 Tax=Mycetocola lacteus TaxID=76637 RepID=A0A3L7AU00_9MICO|nr:MULTISPECIES: FHA domain-containing protein [Mycetocola]MCS4277951.1 pSer/pThr/pTyr-binding forkhead associated (FHA) protein [Mycetocola sp. BIGb0189]RLP83465.1 FHA domain-containing protein [Mycetocola lacteus]